MSLMDVTLNLVTLNNLKILNLVLYWREKQRLLKNEKAFTLRRHCLHHSKDEKQPKAGKFCKLSFQC